MKLLVPTDFSDNANNALEFAKKMAQKKFAKLTLFFAYYAIYDFAAQATQIVATIEHDAEKALKKAAKQGNDVGLEIDYKLQFGTVATAITSFAYQKEYDLIVMGTQGASGIKKSVIGSNTGHVVKDSLVPILAIPTAARFENVKKIAIALELIHEQEKFFDTLFRLTAHLGLTYEFFHVQTTPSFERSGEYERIAILLQKKYPQFNINLEKVEAKDVNRGINAYLKANSEVLLVMFSKNKTFFEYLFDQSASLDMAYHTHVPLMVIK
jgi:nucleotide-binding universal stress UspA family protein